MQDGRAQTVPGLELPPAVVFVTSHAVAAFALGAVDWLKKTVRRQRPTIAAMPATENTPAPPLRAAREAADFVARMFADIASTATPQIPAAPAAAPIPSTTPSTPPAARAPVPANWPAGTPCSLHGQRIWVVGLGLSGLALARWAVRCGAASVTVLDSRSQPPQLGALQAQLPGAHFACGALDAGWFDKPHMAAPDALWHSPGLSPAQLAPLLDAARARQIPALGELGVFADALAQLARIYDYRPALLAITGTNGKTTTAELTAHVLAHAGRDVALAGNIGPTLLDTLTQRLQAQALPQAWVLELSSFQLASVHQFAATAAALLNIDQDHLDWHGSTSAYVAAKARIFGADTIRVLNRDDAQALRLQTEPEAKTPQKTPRPRGKNAQASVPCAPRTILFGSDAPRRAGDYGLEDDYGLDVAGTASWLAYAENAPDGETAPTVQRLMPCAALALRGRHNAANALAALALAHAAGCPLAPLLHGLRSYRGAAHRIQPIAQAGGITWFDDSKGTNVAATRAALAAVAADFQPLAVILGGDGKGQDFAPLRAAVARHAQAVVLIGRDAPRLRAALHGCGVPVQDAPDMPTAVARAAASARAAPGYSGHAAVLLSPACASLDMYRDYHERAQHFAAAVQALGK